MIRFLFSFLLIVKFSIAANTIPPKPKLVVGIVVDQMRLDYFYRFAHQYGEKGFKRLMNNSAFMTEAYYNYLPTFTAVGHASIYTGSIPQLHGIVGNDWYDMRSQKHMYCVQDLSVEGVGTQQKEGKMSPKNLLASTFADELKLSSNFQSKTFGVSVKDRGAVLPGGKMADAAYWYVGGDEGKFVTSTYYRKDLPAWVENFNKTKIAPYLDSTWNTLLPIEQYTQSRSDEYYNEIPFKSFYADAKAVFPYVLKELRKSNHEFSILPSTPFGNTLVKDFAKALIIEEKLGKGKAIDFIGISFSSTDKIGHQFGIYSVEVQDTYLRLDRDLADLLSFLDTQIGANNYAILFTADHAGMDIPSYLAENRLHAGPSKERALKQELENKLAKVYGEGPWILDMSNFQIFLNKQLIKQKNIPLEKIENQLLDELREIPYVNYTSTSKALAFQGNFIHQMFQNGFHLQRSGDIFYQFDPYFADTFNNGNGIGLAATHGSPYTYDTHVPLLLMGPGIKPKKIHRKVNIQDGIVTLSNYLEIAKPNAATGEMIHEVFP